MLPYQVPFKVGFKEILWQIGGLEELELTGRSRGSIFPTCTVAHQFVIIKGGWVFLYRVLNPYKMATTHPKFNDSEGYFEIFRQRAKAKAHKHEFYYPENIIRNEFSLEEK